MCQKFRLYINEARNCFFEEIEQTELMRKKHRNVCATLNYLGHVLILASTITGCISISAFSSLSGNPSGITSFAIGLNTCVTATGTKTFKKNKYKHD